MGVVKRVNSTHVRLSDEADAMLELLAEARNLEKATLLSDACERVLLGEGHALKVAALRLARSGILGTGREGA